MSQIFDQQKLSIKLQPNNVVIPGYFRPEKLAWKVRLEVLHALPITVVQIEPSNDT